MTGFATVRAVAAGPGDTVVVAGAAGAAGLVAAQLTVAAGARVLGVAGPANNDWLRAEGVDLAVALGVPVGRIDTVADFAAAGRTGAKTEGAAAASTADIVADLLARIERGELELPVDRTFPLDDVVEAFRYLESRHGRGKVVRVP